MFDIMFEHRVGQYLEWRLLSRTTPMADAMSGKSHGQILSLRLDLRLGLRSK